MATRSDISVFWNTSPRLIVIASPSTEVTIQDLHDTLRDIEDEPGALQYPTLISSAGKEPLGGGVTVGLTSTLNNAQVMFERRAVAVTEGTFTSDSVPGRLVIATDTAASFETDGVEPGYFLVNTVDESHAEVVEIIDENNLLVLSPTGGAENDYDTGEAYIIYENVECNVSGGNLVAADEVGDPISPVFPSFGTFLVRTSSSSATLQELADIQYASFNGGITVDVTSPYFGTNYPNGTPRQPVNNIADAVEMATVRGFTTLFVIGDITLDNAVPSLNGFTFVGESANKTAIQIDTDADVENSEFMTASINGILDGGNVVSDCVIETLNFVDGFITQCVLNGTITLSTQDDAHFLDCWSGVPGLSTPTIDFSGAGSALAMRNYNGGVTLRNKTGSEAVSIDLNSGQVVLEDTVTAGTIVLRGIGTWTNETTYTGGADVVNQLINPLDAHSVAFSGGVTVDVTTSNTGTIYPTGTTRLPVNNITDALTIAATQGLNQLYIIGNITITEDITGFTVIGQSAILSTITIDASATVASCEFKECVLNGVLDGGNIIRSAIIADVTGFNGVMFETMIVGSVTLGGGAPGNFLSCYSDVTPAIIDYNGSGQSLVVRDFSGSLVLTNKTGADVTSVDLSGDVTINDSVVASDEMILRGIGTWTNEITYAGGVDIHNNLVNPHDIQVIAFDGRVTIDVTSSYSGTNYPAGTVRMPVNNLADAIVIANNNDLNILQIIGSFTFTPGDNVDNFIVVGQNAELTMIIIPPGVSALNTEFQECTIGGVLSGGNIIRNAITYNISEFNGVMFNTMIIGTVSLGGTPGFPGPTRSGILSCYSGDPGTETPTINFNGADNSVIMRDYSGNIELINKTGTNNSSFDIHGEIEVDDTVDAGTITLRGLGEWTNRDTYAGSATIIDEMVSNTSITDSIDDNIYDGKAFSDIMADLLAMANGRIVESPAGTFSFYEQDNTTVRFTLVKSGSQRIRS